MIEFKEFEKSDFSQLINWIDSPRLLRQWGGSGFEFPLDEQQLDSYLTKTTKNEKKRMFIYKVCDKETEKVVGHLSLGNIDSIHKSARIGRVLVGNQSMRGKGIGEEMIKEALRIGFNELKLHRISLGVFDHNQAALHCYEKVGFKKEGLLRDTIKFEDDYWSIWEMSMLEDEWKKP